MADMGSSTARRRWCAAAAWRWMVRGGRSRMCATSRQHEHERPVPRAKKATKAAKFHTVKNCGRVRGRVRPCRGLVLSREVACGRAAHPQAHGSFVE